MPTRRWISSYSFYALFVPQLDRKSTRLNSSHGSNSYAVFCLKKKKTWWPHANSELLEPVNDVMEPLIKQNGAVNGTVQYLGQLDGKWLGVPACVGSQIKGPCSRIDLMKKYANIDVQEMYPAGGPPKADDWTMDTFLKAAEACHKGGFPFGIGLGTTADNVDTAGAVFQSFGAELVDAKGNIAVKS